MITEKEYFSQWVDKFKTLVSEENANLVDKFSIEAARDERGCTIPYLDTDPLLSTSKEHEALIELWKIFLKNNPY